MIEGVGEIPENALFVSTDVVNLCPSISHKACLSAFEEAFNKRNLRKILIETLVKIANFVFGNNCFEFNEQTFQRTPHLMRAFVWIKLKMDF